MKQELLRVLPPMVYLALKRWDYKRTRPAQFERLQEMRHSVTERGYSYEPFDSLQAIFVHIPKCGGVSMSRTIFGNLAGGHTALEEYLNIFEPSCVINYFKFTVVRNPWARLVSAYFFLRDGGLGEKDRVWFDRELGGFNDFDDFVQRWVNKTNIWKLYHFHPQYHYMIDRRQKIRLDFVAFLENIEDDFVYITNRIGIERTLDKMNKSTHSSYMGYYSETTKRIVADAYAEDIEMLGYNFDNSSLKSQLADRAEGKIYSLRSGAYDNGAPW